MMNVVDRETWLKLFSNSMVQFFKAKGYNLDTDNIRFSCGFPAGSRGSNKAIGQCWSKTASKDGHNEIFISPIIDDSIIVMATTVHELCHVIVGTQEGHNPIFGKCARAIGLEGHLTATTSGSELRQILILIRAAIGTYPHAELMFRDPEKKKEGTRLIKVVCPECGYTVRAAKKWLDKGLTTCPCGQLMEAN